jgi:hypothetical protein
VRREYAEGTVGSDVACLNGAWVDEQPMMEEAGGHAVIGSVDKSKRRRIIISTRVTSLCAIPVGQMEEEVCEHRLREGT